MELYRAFYPAPLKTVSHPGAGADAGWVIWNAERMLGAAGHAVYALIVKELHEPTLAFDEFFERSMQPIYAAGEELIAAVFGVSQDQLFVQPCCTSVFGQCLISRYSRPIIERFQRHASPAQLERIRSFLRHDPDVISGLANYIADFSLAGITAQAQRMGK